MRRATGEGGPAAGRAHAGACCGMRAQRGGVAVVHGLLRSERRDGGRAAGFRGVRGAWDARAQGAALNTMSMHDGARCSQRRARSMRAGACRVVGVSL